jgi:hypothetical protein
MFLSCSTGHSGWATNEVRITKETYAILIDSDEKRIDYEDRKPIRLIQAGALQVETLTLAG